MPSGCSPPPTSAACIEVIGQARTPWRLGAPQPIAIGGTLFVHGTAKRPALEAFVAQAHTRLLQLLACGEHVRHPAAAAHLARGLALHRIPAGDIPILFTCFSPEPRDAASLALLLDAKAPILIIDSPDPLSEHPAVVNDGSPLSLVVLDILGTRARRETAPPPRSRHPIQPVVDAVQARLLTIGLTSVDCVIADRAEPTVWFDDVLRMAGDDPQLRALAAAQLANSPFAAAALDALAAHVVTVLNAALTDVTDASESHALRVLLTQA
ncbi:MAG: hypothetical protein H0T79_06005 [Deltaproteobacteria bacterium]|nr:hypothetical protein [Deltaproteobacteria bacterium]